MSPIKHLVIPGGAIYGLSFYGSLKHLFENKAIDINNIKTIHSTSVGCIISTVIALKFDWNEVDNYFINRPWQEVFKFSLCSIINCFTCNGLFDISTLNELFLPLFAAKDISIGVTMKEFYDITKIELHFFTVEIATFSLVDISYHSFPEWTVIESVYASACAPILFKPFKKNNVYYTDGGILANCPVKELFESSIKPSPKEVLCITTADVVSTTPFELNLIQYVFYLITKIVNRLQPCSPKDPDNKEYEVQILQNILPTYDVLSIANSPHQRKLLIEHGVASAHKCCCQLTQEHYL